MFSTAVFNISWVKAIKSVFLATKSVSLLRLTIAPLVPSKTASTHPSLASLSARLAATASPFSRIMSTAFSKYLQLLEELFYNSSFQRSLLYAISLLVLLLFP